jgi:hypothetical protein
LRGADVRKRHPSRRRVRRTIRPEQLTPDGHSAWSTVSCVGTATCVGCWPGMRFVANAIAGFEALETPMRSSARGSSETRVAVVVKSLLTGWPVMSPARTLLWNSRLSCSIQDAKVIRHEAPCRSSSSTEPTALYHCTRRC